MTEAELARRIRRETEKCDCCPTLDERAAQHLARIVFDGFRTLPAPRWTDREDREAENWRLHAELHRERFGPK